MAQESSLTLTFPEPDIALLTFDTPGKGANVLSQPVLEDFERKLASLESRSDIAGLIFSSGKPGIFIAGADLREFLATLGAPAEQIISVSQAGQALFARLSACPFVTVAAIDGICVGGGAELAIWCDRRILSDNPKTEFGFPEVKLGLYPGWGGTARAPRIVGLGNAVELITSGESIGPAEALKQGLASAVTSPDALLGAAVRLIRLEQATGDYLRDRQTWSGPLAISEAELGFLGATASAVIQGQTKGQYPAPLAALEVLLGAAGETIETA
ncbi:MAG: enoyl-CoA hydratase/isomerase family protein, partial [Planctomycetales bacterium]|nr:enoyl-CoA hydratase/isomerase family protein [Planctomycetales bacterium]